MTHAAATLDAKEPQPGVAEDDRPDVGAYSLRGIGRLLVASGTGKAAIAVFAVMLLISLWVVVTFPSGFGPVRWSNPTYWADNPKTVAPKWTAWFGGDAVEHVKSTLTAPTSTTVRGAAQIREFDVPIAIDGDTPPSFLSATILGVAYSSRAPVIVATLIRPDGGKIRLLNLAVPAPRPGETAPYRRFYDTPERQLLTQQETAATSLAQWFQKQYPGAASPPDLAAHLNRGLFASPSADGSGALAVLRGAYTLSVQVVVADPKDEVAGVRVVEGGTVYGWMGTDSIGRDLWQGLLYGFPVGLLIATLAAILSTAIGASLGILSGYAGGKTDAVIQRLSDIISNVPVLPLLIFLVFVFGSHLYLIILALVAFSWPGLTILVRSMVLQIRSGQLVEAAQALGASRTRIMARHVFPQTAPFIVAQMIFFAPGAILAEASLSFIGLGDPSIPTWGQMLEAGFQTGALYVGFWWWVIPPGVLIIFTAVAFMLLALAMEPIVDPRLRKTN